MRQFALSAFLVMALAGCASTAPYGNFATEPPAGLEERIAADTVKQLVALYPPARTRFHLGQPTPDAYGSALVEALRAKGYALVEVKEAAPATAPGLSLHYVLDAVASPNLYRVTVMVGQKSLSRAYLAQNDRVAPAGAWVRKE
ncbi:MAG: conjugal transfer protein TrbH [Sulfuritalea sp.]|nr:conjugal transfer protein TrbH [Sulfuritalea sp.]